MNKFYTISLLESLTHDIKNMQEVIHDDFATKPETLLNRKPAPKSWSALESLQHIVMANEVYVERITQKLAEAPQAKLVNSPLKPGIFGNMMVNMLKPKGGDKIKNKMKTLDRFTPKPTSGYQKEQVLTDLDRQLGQLLLLLEKASSADLNKVKIKSAIGSVLTFKLGDAFRFVTAHSQRHVLQALNAIAE